MPAWILIAFVAFAAVLALLVGARPELARSREGRILAFVGLFLLPVGAIWGGFSQQMDRATTTKFCLSCHVMEDYGKTVLIDDRSYLPAAHYQNNRVPRDHACYACHTDYTMFGTVSAKLKGVRHLMVQYLGTVPKPEDIKLYEPFSNRECLHCHQGARRFEDSARHKKLPDQLARMKSGQLSCMSSGCHEIVHDVASLKDATFWKELPIAEEKFELPQAIKKAVENRLAPKAEEPKPDEAKPEAGKAEEKR
jgi:cytochrome c-type protein NapC